MNEENKKFKSEVIILVSVFVVAFVVKLFFFDIVNVSGSSMEPTLHNGEIGIVMKNPYTPEIGDIVVVSFGKDLNFIKRVVGVGGDTISIQNGVLYRNGEPVQETYVMPGAFSDSEEVTVPDGEYFVLGDNRENSTDSRSDQFGTVEREYIEGKLIFTF